MTDAKGKSTPRTRKKDAQAEKPFNAGLDLEIDAIDLIHKIGSQRTISRAATSTQARRRNYDRGEPRIGR